LIIDASSPQEFSDADHRIVAKGDQSKKLKWLLSAISANTTRTFTVPDADITISSFIATLLDDATAAAARTTLGAQADLGFTPVQQGGGSSMTTDKMYLGWSAAGPRLQVNGSPLGVLWTDWGTTFSGAYNGYIKFPNGVIFQWGIFTAATDAFGVVGGAMPIAFPNIALGGMGYAQNHVHNPVNGEIRNHNGYPTVSQIYFVTPVASTYVQVGWLAWGY